MNVFLAEESLIDPDGGAEVEAGVIHEAFGAALLQNYPSAVSDLAQLRPGLGQRGSQFL